MPLPTLLDGDQQREAINTRQRFEAFRAAERAAAGYRGSMVFAESGGIDYLLRAFYEPSTGRRRQKSLGRRSPETERIEAEFHTGREAAKERLAAARAAIERQAAVNRALGLSRVPDLAARILRALDAAGLLGEGLRVAGTHALYAYEAAAGLHFPSEVTTTEDIDLLLDSRSGLDFLAGPRGEENEAERSLLGLLKRVDRSFERAGAAFRAVNRDGYLVDLIAPLRDPPWRNEPAKAEAGDLEAVAIEGLVWLESAPVFEAVAIDARGYPVRIVTVDPRAFAVHKLWLSTRADRPPASRRRDRAQAEAVGALVATAMPHLPFEPEGMRSFPRAIVEAAAPLFAAESQSGFTW